MASQAYSHFMSRKDIAQGTKFRILPLGDSITEGYMSSDGNGYRLELLNDLNKTGNEVEFVGTERSGNMTRNRHCGFGGWTIAQVSGRVGDCVKQKPNLILLHIGTNDMNNEPAPPGEPFHDAPYRLSALIDALFAALPDTTLLLAQIAQSTTPATHGRIEVFNEMVPVIAEEKKKERIVVVRMSAIGANETTSADGLHPNDRGYGMMARVWVEGVREAGRRGWIREVDEEG